MERIFWLLLLLLLSSFAHGKPVNVMDNERATLKLPLLSSNQQQQQQQQPQSTKPSPDDVAAFTTMFLNLFKGIGDWRNMIAADTVQSVFQSPPVVDYSKRIFGT